MLEYIGEMFSYPFMQRTFLVGILVVLRLLLEVKWFH